MRCLHCRGSLSIVLRGRGRARHLQVWRQLNKGRGRGHEEIVEERTVFLGIQICIQIIGCRLAVMELSPEIRNIGFGETSCRESVEATQGLELGLLLMHAE